MTNTWWPGYLLRQLVVDIVGSSAGSRRAATSFGQPMHYQQRIHDAFPPHLPHLLVSGVDVDDTVGHRRRQQKV